MAELVRGACPLDCPDTCGLVTKVVDDQAVDLYGDPDHPITRGWLCAKVRLYLDHVYHPERLRRPLRRSGPKGSGQWTSISWAEAIAEIAGRWNAIIDQHGPEAILPYSFSGTLGLVQLEVSNSRFWNRLGTSRLQRSICDAAVGQAIALTLGARYSQPYSDIQHSRLVIIWGHNPVSTAPHFMPFLRQAQRNGTQVVVIDPRKSRTARGADWHLAPIPGSDGVLALGLAHIIVAEGLHAGTWLAEHAHGWPAFRRHLDDFTPGVVAAQTGLLETDLLRLARLYATSQPAIIKIGDGLNRNLNGGQNIRAILALPGITGQYGQRGGGLAASTGDYLNWDAEAVSKKSQCPPPGRWVNMNRLGEALLGEANDPPIQSLFVFAANPVASSPNAGRIIQGLQREDLFTVVHELYMTDTADYADIVLPATSQLEQSDLHKAYGHTLLSYNRPAIAPLGEAKSNWDVFRLLAQALGFEEPWLQQTADQVIEEVLTATAVHQPALEGITFERLRREGTIPLVVPAEPPFASGQFATPNGKLMLQVDGLTAEGQEPLPKPDLSRVDDGGFGRPDERFSASEALTLLSGAAHHFVSSSQANQAGLLSREGQPYIEIHPIDAAARGIQPGSEVVVENGRGWVRLKAVVTEGIRPGVAASPKGYWPKLSGGRNINRLTSDDLADFAGQAVFQSTRVWLRLAE